MPYLRYYDIIPFLKMFIVMIDVLSVRIYFETQLKSMYTLRWVIGRRSVGEGEDIIRTYNFLDQNCSAMLSKSMFIL